VVAAARMAEVVVRGGPTKLEELTSAKHTLDKCAPFSLAHNFFFRAPRLSLPFHLRRLPPKNKEHAMDFQANDFAGAGFVPRYDSPGV
jgi:hypothetical protein